MSTRVLSEKVVAQVVGTITSYYDEHFGSPDLLKRRFANDTHDLMSATRQHMPEEFSEGDITSPGELNQALYKFLVSQNKLDYEESYYDHNHEENTKMWEEMLEKGKDLDFSPFPMNLKGMSVFHAMLSDVAYNSTIGEKNELAKVFNDFEDKLATMIIKSQPDYPKTVDSVQNLALDLISLRANGDMLYMQEGAMRGLMNAFEFESRDSKGHFGPIIYGDEYFALLMEQLIEHKSPVELPTEWNNVSRPMPSLKQLSEAQISIQADIPKASMEKVLKAAHLFHKMNAQIDDMKPEDFVGFNGNVFSQEDYEELRDKFSDFTRRHDYALSHNLPGFDRAITLVYSKENDTFEKSI